MDSILTFFQFLSTPFGVVIIYIVVMALLIWLLVRNVKLVPVTPEQTSSKRNKTIVFSVLIVIGLFVPVGIYFYYRKWQKQECPHCKGKGYT